MKAVLLTYHHVPGSHTGEYITEKLLHILDQVNISHKVSLFEA
jgi:hypothetical protein